MEPIDQTKKVGKMNVQMLAENVRNSGKDRKSMAEMFPKMNLPEEVVYYPYNMDVDDRNWGCAWRAIQTYLSCERIYLSFQHLLDAFSAKEVLLDIARSANIYSPKVMQELTINKWAPAEISNNWAEPFIAKLISLQVSSRPHRLQLINGFPPANAPESVFEGVISFKQLIISVRKTISQQSIMIDDGKYALSVVGVEEQEAGRPLALLFADPHIMSNRECRNAGIYRVEFTSEGDQIGSSLTPEQKQQQLYPVVPALEFKTKKWMVLF